MENLNENSGNNQNQSPPRGFNWALLLGCCAIALAIYLSGSRISSRIPHVIHGNFTTPFVQGSFGADDREFMSEWDAARFIMVNPDEFHGIIESGELSGTYTVFQVERREWRIPREFIERAGVGVFEFEAAVPVQQEYDIVITDHRVFSRERLTEWLHNRMDAHTER